MPEPAVKLPPLPEIPGLSNEARDAMATQLAKLSPAELQAYLAQNRAARDKQLRETKLYQLYPNDGPLRRELYRKHLLFFGAGGQHATFVGCQSDCTGEGHQERSFISGNRTGKTLAVCYELTCHLIGWYPQWWTGRRFNRPVAAWISGEDAKAVRESLQVTLLGTPDAHGTGLIPKVNIAGTTARPGVPDAVDTITVKTSWGGVSRVLAKTYDQGRESFQAAAVDIMVFDEEPPSDIYSEGLTRTMSTVPGQPNGIVMCSFTPLSGLSNVVLSYLPGGKPVERR